MHKHERNICNICDIFLFLHAIPQVGYNSFLAYEKVFLCCRDLTEWDNVLQQGWSWTASLILVKGKMQTWDNASPGHLSCAPFHVFFMICINLLTFQVFKTRVFLKSLNLKTFDLAQSWTTLSHTTENLTGDVIESQWNRKLLPTPQSGSLLPIPPPHRQGARISFLHIVPLSFSLSLWAGGFRRIQWIDFILIKYIF